MCRRASPRWGSRSSLQWRERGRDFPPSLHATFAKETEQNKRKETLLFKCVTRNLAPEGCYVTMEERGIGLSELRSGFPSNELLLVARRPFISSSAGVRHTRKLTGILASNKAELRWGVGGCYICKVIEFYDV